MPTEPQFLTSVAAHLDKHMLIPVLRFAAEKAATESLRAEYAAAAATVAAQTSIEVADSAKKAELDAKFAKTVVSTGPLKELFFNYTEEEGFKLKYVGREYSEAVRHGKFSPADLLAAKVKDKNMAALYSVAFLLVENGKYAQAADVLKVHNTILAQGPAPTREDETKRATSALWGQFLCDALLHNQDNARPQLDSLLRNLDELSAEQGNTSRAALLHWSLFHYFIHHETNGFLDLLFQIDRVDRSKTHLYANVIQCSAPHLLRYVAVAAVLNKKKKSYLFKAARLIDSQSYQYQDPVTDFLLEMCIKTDFVRGAALIPVCEQLLAGDFFCADLREEFVSNARQIVFEDQLRVRKSLSIATAAGQLGMPIERAELWLVDLIREAKLDATVDSVAGTVRVNVASTQKSVWQHVMDRLEIVDRNSGSAVSA